MAASLAVLSSRASPADRHREITGLDANDGQHHHVIAIAVGIDTGSHW